MQVHAYAAKQALTPFRFALRELGPGEVDVQGTHCGICTQTWRGKIPSGVCRSNWSRLGAKCR